MDVSLGARGRSRQRRKRRRKRLRHQCWISSLRSKVGQAFSLPDFRHALLALCQKHVGDDGHAGGSPMAVRKVYAAHADRGSNAHQMRPGQQSSFRDRTEIVDLQFDGGETSRALEMTVQSRADGCVCNARRDASVQRTLAVEQLRPYAALDGHTIAMHAHQFESQQVIKGVPGEEISDEFGAAPEVAQVW